MTEVWTMACGSWSQGTAPQSLTGNHCLLPLRRRDTRTIQSGWSGLWLAWLTGSEWRLEPGDHSLYCKHFLEIILISILDPISTVCYSIPPVALQPWLKSHNDKRSNWGEWGWWCGTPGVSTVTTRQCCKIFCDPWGQLRSEVLSACGLRLQWQWSARNVSQCVTYQHEWTCGLQSWIYLQSPGRWRAWMWKDKSDQKICPSILFRSLQSHYWCWLCSKSILWF